MSGTILLIAFLATGLVLASQRAASLIWVAALFLLTLFGIFFTQGWLATALTVMLGAATLVLALLSQKQVRKILFTGPIFKSVKSSFPRISDTERIALEAGTTGWDAELFSGAPNWQILKDIPKPELTSDEQAFIDGPTNELCQMIDDWEMRHSLKEVPQPIWDFIKDNGFFGMVIDKSHGGLGFSAQAQSIVIGKIASRSADIAIVVMVPNSLGPGELVERYGTDHQKDKYLEPLANGKEVPCFALTGPTSGSDAANMRDVGTVVEKKIDGKPVLGIEVSCDKRYITLAPVATVVGLAFYLYDPDHHLGKKDDIGITLALIPASHKGLKIGRRHLPSGSIFPNGPIQADRMFIPVDWIIGGQDMAGQGWRMLMECLSTGRAISLPATSSAATKHALRVSSAYGAIRKQFGIPIGKMEGIEEPLARMIDAAYTVEAGRSMTAAIVDMGQRPAVLSALLKYQATDRMRESVRDAMDIHGGRAICDGPSNYLQSAYQSVPIGITVEGANILTRSLITFSQGAMRCHPYLLKESEALLNENEDQGFDDFDNLLSRHISHFVGNIGNSVLHNLTGSFLVKAPDESASTQHLYKKLGRASANFAVMADIVVMVLGGTLKRKQKISGRMADALSEIYLISSILKRFENDGQQASELPVVEFCVQNALARFYDHLRGVAGNFPVPVVGSLMRLTTLPLFGPKQSSDATAHKLVKQALQPGQLREALTRYIFISDDKNDVTGRLEYTMRQLEEMRPIEKKVEKAAKAGLLRIDHQTDWLSEAVENGILSVEEKNKLQTFNQLVNGVISVDHFDPDEVRPHFQTPDDDYHLAAE